MAPRSRARRDGTVVRLVAALALLAAGVVLTVWLRHLGVLHTPLWSVLSIAVVVVLAVWLVNKVR